MKIALCAIVKNEEQVLERMIESVNPIVDKFFIVDTGSTDNTEKIIEKYQKRAILIPFKNFVKTKNDALDMIDALIDIDYILWFDADEYFENEKQAMQLKRHLIDNPELTHIETYINDIVNGRKVNCYTRTRIWKNHLGMRFAGPNVHECLTTVGKKGIDFSIFIQHEHNETKDWKFRLQFYIDELKKYLKGNPNNLRALFYLGQTYSQTQQWDHAIETYDEYLSESTKQNSNFYEEIYAATIELANNYYNLGKKGNAIITLDNLCDDIDDKTIKINRNEVYLTLAQYLIWENNKRHYKRIKKLLLKAASIPFPMYNTLLANPEHYTWMPYDLLQYIYSQLGEYDNCLKILNKLATFPDVQCNENHMITIQQNRQKTIKELVRNPDKSDWLNDMKSEMNDKQYSINARSKPLIIELPTNYDGLGDHLLFSHLPRIAKKFGGYTKVLISNKNTYKGAETKKLVWECNPYIDGFTDEKGTFVAKLGLRETLIFGILLHKNINLMDQIMYYYDLNDLEYYHQPEIYLKDSDYCGIKGSGFRNLIALEYYPTLGKKINNDNTYNLPEYTIYDGNFKANAGITHHQVMQYFKNNKYPTVQFDKCQDELLDKPITYFDLPDVPKIKCKNLIHYCHLINQSETFYTLMSGGALVAAACPRLKETIVLTSSKTLQAFKLNSKAKYINLEAKRKNSAI